MAKIMKDTAQEQALLEVADLLQQLKILDNSTKNPESSLSCTYRVGGGRMQRLPISENYLVSMIATVQTDLQKKINNLCIMQPPDTFHKKISFLLHSHNHAEELYQIS